MIPSVFIQAHQYRHRWGGMGNGKGSLDPFSCELGIGAAVHLLYCCALL